VHRLELTERTAMVREQALRCPMMMLMPRGWGRRRELLLCEGWMAP
jgi:hypothetical protein